MTMNGLILYVKSSKNILRMRLDGWLSAVPLRIPGAISKAGLLRSHGFFA